MVTDKRDIRMINAVMDVSDGRYFTLDNCSLAVFRFWKHHVDESVGMKVEVVPQR
jgi:hypothetical protein